MNAKYKCCKKCDKIHQWQSGVERNLPPPNWDFRRSISSWSCRINFADGSSLTTAWFTIRFARSAYLCSVLFRSIIKYNQQIPGNYDRKRWNYLQLSTIK